MTIILANTSTCPRWCTAHDVPICGTRAEVPGFTLTMSQVVAESAEFYAQAEPTVWLNDEPLTLDEAGVLAAALGSLVVEAQAARVVDVRLPSPRHAGVPVGARGDAGSAGLLLLVPVLAIIFSVLGVMAIVGGSGPWGAVLLALAPVTIVAAVIAGSGGGQPRPRPKRYLSEAGNTTVGLVVAAFIVAAPVPFFIDFVAKAAHR